MHEKTLPEKMKPPAIHKKPGILVRSIKLLAVAHLLYLLTTGFNLANYLFHSDGKAWWEGSRASSGQAPDPAQHKNAVIQVYAARAARWRGALGVHTWIAVKPANADHYTRIEVFGFNLRRYGNTVSVVQRTPDNYWYARTPELLRDIRGGKQVDQLINRLLTAAGQYPYEQRYRLWPGPNSNTFIGWLARAVPELQLELPVTAVGKDYLPENKLITPAPSGTGLQISLGGIYGLLVAIEEGIEITLLGFTGGVDFSPFAIKLPGMGRIGLSDFTAININK